MRFASVLPLLLLAALSTSVSAQTVPNDGYARDPSGQVVKNPFGLCWRTPHWSPEKAIADCDPDYVAKPQPRRVEAPAPALAPAPAPAPKVAEVVQPTPVASAPLAPMRRTESVTLGADTSFDTGKADLKSEGQAKLDQLAVKLKEVRYDSITVVGHTDNVGTDVANQKLSLRRANAVKAYLASHGIDAAKIKTAGRGKTSPIADNKTVQGRARNRRVEVQINGTRTL
jgi:OmpA-OmpF porin, OOP family